MGINISASNLSSLMRTEGVGIGATSAKVTFGTSHGKEKKQETQEPKSEMQQLVDSFKATEVSPVEKRIKEIFNKFKAGKKLTPAELSYLAKNNPDLYKEVRQIMQEREAMEREMEMAKTKLEAEQASINAMMQVKAKAASSATSEDPEITMARSNQLSSARVEYTATLEYQQKEDTEDQTEEQIKALKESDREEQKTTDTAELTDTSAAVDSADITNTSEETTDAGDTSKNTDTGVTETSKDETGGNTEVHQESNHSKKRSQSRPINEIRSVAVDTRV